jgi:hypothetical protein
MVFDRRHTLCGASWVPRLLTRGALLAALGALAAPSTASAQRSGDGFLFGQPAGTFTLRGGFDRASAGSDVFSQAIDQLTLGRNDFSALSVGADLAFRLAPRLDVAFGAAYSGSEAPSEFRDFVDQDDLPIEQSTTLRRVPLTASLKAYLAPRGRSIGRFAWVPSKIAPYVGGGGGAMWYRFQQQGDFVDFETNEIFPDELESSGWTPTGHALAGIDVSLGPRFLLTGEGRYTWARASLGNDFVGFDRIDLSGFALTAGVAVRF